MATSVTLAIKEHAIISSMTGEENNNDHTSTSVYNSEKCKRVMLVKYADVTGDNRKHVITSGSAAATQSRPNVYVHWGARAVTKAFDAATVTKTSYGLPGVYAILDEPPFDFDDDVSSVLWALKYGMAFSGEAGVTVTPGELTVSFSDEYAQKKIYDFFINDHKMYVGTSTKINTAQDNSVSLFLRNSAYSIDWPTVVSAKLSCRAPHDYIDYEIDLPKVTEYEYSPPSIYKTSELVEGTFPGNLVPDTAKAEGKILIKAAVTDSNGNSVASPWYELELQTLVFKTISPDSGSFVDRTKAALFSAALYDGCTLSAFKWRKSGTTDATTVALSGVTSYTMPANTITDGAEYEFTFNAVDKYGVESDYDVWNTFTTIDAPPMAATLAPSGTIVETNSDTVFTWTHSTSTGSSATKSELQYSADEATWTDLATVTGSATEYTLAAGTLTTGTWYWRVRTYNLDSVASEWSNAAQFIAVGKPSTPLITIADNSPRPTITWQVSEQEGYELTIDGEVIRDYGTGKSWTSPRYLTDGTHTVSVRVQNSYGLWSDMATMSFTVENTAGEAVYLSGTAENSATLNWDGVGYDFFVVYRNGKAIAKTENVTYCDRLYAGDATYYVRGCYTDTYNYGISNEIELEILPKNAVLEGIADGATIDLSLSDSQSRSFTWTQTRQSSSYHTAGRALPSYDLAEYLDQTLSGTCAIWKDDRADQRELESLLGQIVCLKTENGEFALGPLVALTKAVGLFYVSYQISVVNSYYEEEISLDS